MATIDNLSIQVTASAESAASAFDRLASSAGSLRGAATRAGGGMRDLAAGAKDAGTATKEAGEQAGNAERHTRDYGRAAQEAGNAAKRGTAGIATFWEALKRVAYYRFVRTIIKAITASFKEGLTHLYQYSNAINGHFAKSLDNLATSTLYLKNSLGTLAAPLIEALAPALEWIIDKVVEVINFINMFVAAISGKSSYTAAVKVATTATAEWGKETTKTTKTAKESIDELKRTILGFDEINKLDKDKIIGGSGGSGSGGGSGGTGPSPSSMFEERPLEGFFKDLSGITRGWPDWLKWLLGIGGIAIAGWGISLLPKLIGRIWDALKRLFGITIPDWFKWLFGPKDGGGGIDFPDKIDIPDAEVSVDLKKGDWSVLDNIDDVTIPVQLSDSASDLYKDFKNDWESTGSKALYFSPKLDNSAAVLYEKFKREWDASGSKVLYFSPKLDNAAGTLYENFKREWEAAGSKILYLSPKLDNSGKVLWDGMKREWDAAKVTLYATAKLDNTGTVLWNTLKSEWEKARVTLYGTPKLDNTGTVLWNTLKSEWEKARVTLYGTPKLDNTGTVLWNTLKREWEKARVTLYGTPKLDNTGTVLWNTFKREWDSAKSTLYASPKLDNTPQAIWNVFKREWDSGNYEVDVGVKDPTNETAKNFWGRLSDAWDATVTAVDKSLDVVVRPVAKKAGGALNGFFSKIGEWLFGSSNTPETETKVKAVAGLGFSGVDRYGKMNLQGINSVDVYVSLKKSGWTWLDYWLGVKNDSGWIIYPAHIELQKWGWDSLSDWIGNSVTVSVNLAKGGGVVNSNGYTASFAEGGTISNGVARKFGKIPRYAGGTSDAHGTLFLAGEAGPEIVGHVGGRTEILNQSQLAQTMFAAVRNAMSGVRIGGYIDNAVSGGGSEADYEMMYRAMYDAFTDAMAGSNERDREKVQLMRQIAAKEFTSEPTAAGMNRAQMRANRRAGTTIVPVGT